MVLKLDELEKKGAFPAERLIKRTVTWIHSDDNGEEVTDTFDIFVKCLSVSDIEGISKEENKNYMSLMLSTSLRLGDNGAERLEYKKAMQLDSTLANCLFTAIADVLWQGGKELKK